MMLLISPDECSICCMASPLWQFPPRSVATEAASPKNTTEGDFRSEAGAARARRPDRSDCGFSEEIGQTSENGQLKTYLGFSHGMLTVNANVQNADLLAFVEA
jgi:hypothetical protein